MAKEKLTKEQADQKRADEHMAAKMKIGAPRPLTDPKERAAIFQRKKDRQKNNGTISDAAADGDL